MQGISCISLGQAPAPKQKIACRRSFGHTINIRHPLIEAVIKFASRAAENLRHGNQRASALLISPFGHSQRVNKSTNIQLPSTSSDATVLVGAAVTCLRRIYEPGYQLAKA